MGLHKISAIIAVLLLSWKTFSVEGSPPTLVSLVQLSQTSIRVRWAPPSDGAPVSSYLVSYTDSRSSNQEMNDIPPSDTSADISSLTAEETYTVSVEASSDGIVSGRSKKTSITLRQLNSPLGVTVGEGEDLLTVTVSWEPVENAEIYRVTFNHLKGDGQQGPCRQSTHRASLQVNSVQGQGGRVAGTIPVGTNVEMRVTNMLRAFATYTVVVEAESDALGTGAQSETLVFTTAQTAASAPPTDVKVTVMSSTAVFVEWRRIDICRTANGRIVKYRIQYGMEPGVVTESVERAGNRTSGGNATITGLSPFTIYSIEVAAVNENGEVGVFSNPKTVQTQEDVPGPVDVLTAVPSFFKVFYTWREPLAPNGAITSYSVHFGPTNSSESPDSPISGPQTSFSTPGRYGMGSEVNLTVVASTSVGAGVPVSLAVSTLTRPPAVEARVVVRLNATSVHVYWNRLSLPDSDTESYTVVYSPVSETQGQEREMVAVFPGSASSAIITDLEEDLSYQLQVFATVRVDGEPLEGERGQPLLAQSVADEGEESECGSQSPSVILHGSVFGVAGLLVGLTGGALTAALITYRATRALSERKTYCKAKVNGGESGLASAAGARMTGPSVAERGWTHSRELRERPRAAGSGRSAVGSVVNGVGTLLRTEHNPAYGMKPLREEGGEGEEGGEEVEEGIGGPEYATPCSPRSSQHEQSAEEEEEEDIYYY